ncbi:class I SAM-dependent methyltransferase [Sphingosinicella rhizophila]|uniref:Methyltransferase domain-containing protein n=1 Tax=Sphingosinicella rhizophila TaxID=3050082 RepID=A0ABU3Q707_9SPHN|nr:methyltransferase domain-containing protein [Sphingosinicella sp. GR2756]MDT9598894.1 methyltransferase domain-containing protein [Sphingosinicella sp. GR2756]
MTSPKQLAVRILWNLNQGVGRVRRLLTRGRLDHYDRLHLGSGSRRLEGWANLDIDGYGHLVWDLRKPLPMGTDRARLIYTEHFIEHIPRDDARKLFTHARSVLKSDGILRISTPDLAKIARDYVEGKLVQMPHGNWFPATLCQMMNDAMRRWGHVFVYDQPELESLLRECGYTRIERVRWGESDHPELRGLESRPDFDDLIVEARP